MCVSQHGVLICNTTLITNPKKHFMDPHISPPLPHIWTNMTRRESVNDMSIIYVRMVFTNSPWCLEEREGVLVNEILRDWTSLTFVFQCRGTPRVNCANQVTGFMEFSKTKSPFLFTESPHHSLLCSPDQCVFSSICYMLYTYLFLCVGTSRKSFCAFPFLKLMSPGN